MKFASLTVAAVMALSADYANAAPNRCGGPVAFGTGTYHAIVVPGANETMASGINNRGDIVGVHRVDSDGGHGFLLKNGEYYVFDFHTGGGTGGTTAFVDINDGGVILGRTHFDMFLLQNGRLTRFSIPRHALMPLALNNAGVVIGNLTNLDTAEQYGFVRAKTGHISLFRYPGASATYLFDISSSGAILGVARMPDNTERYFLYSEGKFAAVEPCAAGLRPLRFRGATKHMVGNSANVNPFSDSYVGFMEAPDITTLIEYPGGFHTFLTGANSAGQAIGQTVDSEFRLISFLYAP